jgi:hypothetical protein
MASALSGLECMALVEIRGDERGEVSHGDQLHEQLPSHHLPLIHRRLHQLRHQGSAHPFTTLLKAGAMSGGEGTASKQVLHAFTL